LSQVYNSSAEVEIYFIPVVVHKIYKNASANIDNSIVESAITNLNEDFRSMDGAPQNIQIKFFLARVDENGFCTNGILEKQDDLGVNAPMEDLFATEQSALKALSYWNSKNYFNIWVVESIMGTNFSSSPTIGIPENQGVVVTYDILNSNTLTHEAGHFLGLWHVWGCSGGEDCIVCDDPANMGDLVLDTPPCFLHQNDDNNTDFNVNICDNEVIRVCSNKSIIETLSDPPKCNDISYSYPKANFMSYFRACRNTFSAGQFTRMFHFLNDFQRDLWYPGYIIKSEMIVDKETKFHRDVTIHPGGRLVIEAEAIMAEGTRIHVLEGGQLVVNGGKIRGCDISETERGKWNGISVTGASGNGYEVEFIRNVDTGVDPVIEDVNGFAVEIRNVDSFEAPGNLYAEHTTFNNVDGLMYMRSFFHNATTSIIDDCTQNGGIYGVKNLHGQGIQLKNSKFFDIERECVSSVGGSFLIEGNEFHGDEVDVALTHFFEGERSTINGGNQFRGRKYGIRAAGPTNLNHIITDNVFHGPVEDPDLFITYYDRDIYMDGITNYTIETNQFHGLVGVSSRATVNTSTANNAFNSVSSNEFDGNATGIYPHDSNQDYFFRDNCFNTTHIDAEITGFMENQGDPTGDPANNCFTNQGNINSSIIDIGGSPDVFNYVELVIVENFDCRHAAYAPLVGVNLIEINSEIETECMNLGGGRERLFDNGGTNADNTLYDQMNLIGTHIMQNEFDDARLVLAQITLTKEEGVDLHFLADNLISFYENTPNNLDNPELVQSLKDIAYKNHPSSGYAQAFHYYLTNEFVDNLDLTFLESFEIEERQSMIKGDFEDIDEILIYPNPASDHVTISNSNKINTIKVYTSLGELIHKSYGLSTLNTQNWKNGIYIFSIESFGGESVIQKIIINRF